MVTAILKGRLGNNMFQIGAAISLAHEHNDLTKFDWSLIKNFNLYKNTIFRKVEFGEVNFNEFKKFEQPTFAYHKIPYNGNVCLKGYFQSEKYLNRELMLDVFSVEENTLVKLKEKYKDLLNSETVSIHVRRGDYTKLQNFPLQPMSYYEDALSYFKNSEVLVFSDDIQWCKKNFSNQYHFIDSNKDYEDLWLMSLCDNNIIANSSFSWWGAWLNTNSNKKVIAPKNWFDGGNKYKDTSDLIPNNWNRI